MIKHCSNQAKSHAAFIYELQDLVREYHRRAKVPVVLYQPSLVNKLVKLFFEKGEPQMSLNLISWNIKRPKIPVQLQRAINLGLEYCEEVGDKKRAKTYRDALMLTNI